MASYLLELGERLKQGLHDRPASFCDLHASFLLSRQNESGGYSGRDVGEVNATSHEGAETAAADLYYTGFAIRGLVTLGRFDENMARSVIPFLRGEQQRLISAIDLVSWLYSAMMVQSATGVDLLEFAHPNWPDDLANYLETFRTTDGGYGKSRDGAIGSTYHSFLVMLCYEFIGRTVPNSEQLIDFIRGRQRDDGGFVEILPMNFSGTNPTAAAVAVLTRFDAVTDSVRDNVARFLREVRGEEGGFQANSRIPFCDTLSTFTALMTARDLKMPEAYDSAQVRRFVETLELKSGGFLAAAWDRAADVEYTFYALGILALMNGSP